MILRAYLNTFSDIGYMVTMSQGEKLTVPVSPLNYIYSHFEHVSGISDPGKGVSISKLKILDVLIEQVGQVKKGKGLTDGQVSDERVNVLIEQYEQQLQQSKTMNIPYSPALEVPTGVLFNLVA